MTYCCNSINCAARPIISRSALPIIVRLHVYVSAVVVVADDERRGVPTASIEGYSGKLYCVQLITSNVVLCAKYIAYLQFTAQLH